MEEIYFYYYFCFFLFFPKLAKWYSKSPENSVLRIFTYFLPFAFLVDTSTYNLIIKIPTAAEKKKRNKWKNRYLCTLYFTISSWFIAVSPGEIMTIILATYFNFTCNTSDKLVLYFTQFPKIFHLWYWFFFFIVSVI